ncbi:hypothetical protein CANMA_005406 [Candida margitis]|uniref:uncharacterized protein n=1 Tax=Candida margitis TaxID=1775924 RepID=UPI0022262F7E|nr:uncharacterized protein CANMA_005406 [Candida margitis]KAI5949826.1 hypothetical protein CANMA_005406 [Candida margitis]
MLFKKLSAVQNLEESHKEAERQKSEAYEEEIKKRETLQTSHSISTKSSISSDEEGEDSTMSEQKRKLLESQKQPRPFSAYGKTGNSEKDAKRAAEYEARKARRDEKDEKRGFKKTPADSSWPAWGAM